jgi:hypothetical protein
MENNFTNNGIHTLYKRSQANYKNLIRGGWSDFNPIFVLRTWEVTRSNPRYLRQIIIDFSLPKFNDAIIAGEASKGKEHPMQMHQMGGGRIPL